jgi:anti-sigma factor RsiW
MNQHLTPAILNALADGELTPAQFDDAQLHLAACPQCTSAALAQTMLKTATAKAGHRYAAPEHLQAQLLRTIRQKSSPRHVPKPTYSFGLGAFSAWTAAIATLLICVGILFIQHAAYYRAQTASTASSEYAALASEAVDQHIATLAANAPPQVLSSDRHTVKPWFQGKLPFSFNLPENLPADTTLDGADLTYFHNQPAALLLYSIGKHRVSVFVRQRTGAETSSEPLAEHAGFHVTGFTTTELDVVAVSDVDPARLTSLANLIEQVQAK